MRRMITFEVGNSRFNHRAVAIILDGDWALLHKSENDDFWSLPGGRVELLESSTDALKREMKEELDVDIRIERLVWVVENFFEYDCKSYHEIAFYFLIALPLDSHYYIKDKPFIAHDNGFELTFKWYRIDKLKQLRLYPTLLKKGLNSIPEKTEHIIHTDT